MKIPICTSGFDLFLPLLVAFIPQKVIANLDVVPERQMRQPEGGNTQSVLEFLEFQCRPGTCRHHVESRAMRLVLVGHELPDFRTMQRLLLIADEVGFIDRPSVMFADSNGGQWGTIARDSPMRRFTWGEDPPVTISIHEPPSGPAETLYEPYAAADISNSEFRRTVFEGLKNEPFAWRLIQQNAEHGDERVLGTAIRQNLLADPTLPEQDLTSQSILPMFRGRFGTTEWRRATFKNLLMDASMMATSALAVTSETGLQPVSEDPLLARLLALRSVEESYVHQRPKYASALAIGIASALIPDEVLSHLTIGDIFDYRRGAREPYQAWSTEIDRLASEIEEMDPSDVEATLPRIIHGEVKPRMLQYQNEMRAIRDKMFGDVIKKATTWNVPTVSLAYLASLNAPAAIALFAATLVPAAPAVVDYFVSRRALRRQNSAAYIVGVSRDEFR